MKIKYVWLQCVDRNAIGIEKRPSTFPQVCKRNFSLWLKSPKPARCIIATLHFKKFTKGMTDPPIDHVQCILVLTEENK